MAAPTQVLRRPDGHRPLQCELLLFEPAGVVNTGDASPSDLTAPVDPRI